ncbi:hypothetical protein Btru_010116 [Bulinus truncatus]|nr:hypothetical protein Btru_010116 [Bulinus truncatus]
MSDFSDTSSVSDTRGLMEEKDDGKPRSSIPMTSFNFINSIIGSGIIDWHEAKLSRGETVTMQDCHEVKLSRGKTVTG